jgi:hypothetical protein
VAQYAARGVEWLEKIDKIPGQVVCGETHAGDRNVDNLES